MRTIRLWSMPFEVMLVIEHPSGVVYTNQTCGNICMHPELEGVLAPVELDREQVEKLVEMCVNAFSLSPELADAIDAILVTSPARLVVDRTRLRDSHEAWVHVIRESDQDCTGFEAIRGVITWPNSD